MANWARGGGGGIGLGSVCSVFDRLSAPIFTAVIFYIPYFEKIGRGAGEGTLPLILFKLQ